MSESELLLPDWLSPDSALERLSLVVNGMRLEPADGGVEEADRVFYDTFDGRLRAAGTSAVHEHGRFGFGSLAVDAARPPHRVLATSLEPGPLRDALEPIVDVRALLPLAHLHVRERRLRVLDDERKTVVRVTLEEPVLVDADLDQTALHSRLRLTAVRGYDDSLERMRRMLESELGLEPAALSLLDEAVVARGGIPGGISSKIQVPLEFEQRADGAVVAVLRALLEVVDANLEGTIEDLDSEFLHDLRVAVRRSRSVQREFKHVFLPDELKHFRSEFRWLQQLTGEARDIDVYMLQWDVMRGLVPEAMRPELDPLLQVLRQRRLYAREQMVKGLRSARFSALRHGWLSFLDALPSAVLHSRPDADRLIGRLAGERIGAVYKQMVRRGHAIDEYSPAAEYHELRKKGKELRYLLELFGTPLYPPVVVKPMVRSLKALQDVLGRHQDREVQVATLRSIAAEMSALPDAASALMAMGVLVARLIDDARAARGEFAQRFAVFASHAQRSRVKETFA